MSNIANELLRVIDYISEKAINRGATEVEAYATYSKSVEALAHNNKLHTASEVKDLGVGIRVAIGKKVGFSYTNRFDDESLINAIEKAMEVAKGTPEDRFWRGFPGGPFTYTTPKDTFSKRIADKSTTDAVNDIKSLLDIALRDKRITVVYAVSSYTYSIVAIGNSNGVRGVDEGTATSVGLEVVANEAGYTTPSVFEMCSRRVEECSIDDVVSKAVDKALKALKPIKIEPRTYDVILEPEALSSLFTYTVMPALRGDNVVRGKSPLKGREGEQVTSKLLTIVDDGLVPGGMATSKFDGEGVPKRRTELIVRGVLKGFIYDTYWGRRAEKPSTGNAVRASYNTQPSVGFSNFMVTPGTESIDSYINTCERALLINELQGAHSSNPETGEFSVVAVPAWIVRKGELKAVKGAMIAGNVWRKLKRINFISREVKDIVSLKLPWIGFASVKVIIQ